MGEKKSRHGRSQVSFLSYQNGTCKLQQRHGSAPEPLSPPELPPVTAA